MVAAENESAVSDLVAAYEGELNAHVRYKAYAVRAEAEGMNGAASLFRAAARAEQIHAGNHARVIRHMGGDVEDEPLADLGRNPPFGDGEAGLGQGQAPGDQGQRDDQPLVVPEDAVVDDVPEDERVGHPDHRVDHDQHHEEDEDVAVLESEFQHPLGGALGDGLLDDVGVPAHLAQGSAERPAAAGTPSSSVHHASDHTVGGSEVAATGGGRLGRG